MSLLEDYHATFPVRLGLGLAFFAVMGAWDLVRNRENPRRAKEYAFLAFAAAVAVSYGVIHDHITATISSAYFLEGKGLADDPRPYRVAVTILAVGATYWVGLVLGAAMLIANNPQEGLPQVPYREMARLCLGVVGAALACAVVMGALYGVDAFGLAGQARNFAGSKGATRFLVVWGAHSGSYLGGLVGGVAAVVAVARRRRARACAEGPTTVAKKAQAG